MAVGQPMNVRVHRMQCARDIISKAHHILQTDSVKTNTSVEQTRFNTDQKTYAGGHCSVWSLATVHSSQSSSRQSQQ